MKPLIRVSAEDASALTRALAKALAGGPAVWPVPADAAPGSSAPAAPAAVEVGDGVALVVETSGSTDRPKRVVLSAEALEASAHATHDALGGPGQWLLALPGHYIAGAQVL
ncbi:MAG TPA: o-succinylbenzoate--CoA ligase, partial [Agromyces sp.]